MTAEKYVTLWCDEPGCEEFRETGYSSNAVARSEAKNFGWAYVAGGSMSRTSTPPKDYCATHRPPRNGKGDPPS